MTFNNNQLSISSINSDCISATHMSVSATTLSILQIPSSGTISLGNHTFSAEELGTLLHYLQQLHPESQI